MPKAILTGASSGLGRETAHLLAAQGFELALVGRNRPALENFIAELPESYRPRLKILIADLSEAGAASGLVKRALALFDNNNPLTHMIYCAGFAVSGRAEDIELEKLEACWRVNFTSAVTLSQEAVLEFRKNQRGTIVHVGSGVGRRALPYLSPYCTAKAALHSFNDSLRVELRDTGIDVILFSPGPVQSGFLTSTIHCGPTQLQIPPQNGIPAVQIARKLMKRLYQGSGVKVLGWKGKLIYHLNYFAPRMVDRLLAKNFRLVSVSGSNPGPQKNNTVENLAISEVPLR